MMDSESLCTSVTGISTSTIDDNRDRTDNIGTDIVNHSGRTCVDAAPQDQDAVEPPVGPPNKINFLNVIGLVVNAVNFFLIMSFETSSEFLTYDEISDKYKTLITPKSSAQIILVVDLVLKFAFVLQQFTSRFRGKKVVQEGVSYLYVILSALQFGWTWAFFKEEIHIALVLMFFILAFSAIIVHSQHNIVSSEGGLCWITEFVVIRLPFQIYCGCAIASMALHINICAVKANEPASSLITLAVVSFTILLCVSMICIQGLTKPIYIIPFVLFWNNFWIYQELKDPYIVIYMKFSLATIHGLRDSALTISILCLVGIPIHLLNTYLKKPTTEQR